MSLARWGTVIAAAIALEAALFLLAVRAALTVALPELLAEQAVVAFQELWTPLFQKHSPLGSVA